MTKVWQPLNTASSICFRNKPIKSETVQNTMAFKKLDSVTGPGLTEKPTYEKGVVGIYVGLMDIRESK